MKTKILFLVLLCLVVFSCRKENQTEINKSQLKNHTVSLKEAIALYQTNGLITTTSYTPVVKTTTLTWGTSSGIIQNTNTDPNVIFRTNGDASWLTSGTAGGSSTTLVLRTENYTVGLRGSGIAVRYPFKQGKSYTIQFPGTSNGYEIAGESIDVKNRKPNLQLQLSNSVLPGNDPAPVSLAAPGPVTNITTSASPHSVNFIPTECYEYLRFSARPNTTGISRGDFSISSIKIIETEVLYVDGPATLATNAQDTYSVKSSGLNVNEQFNWAVSGDYEIVGSSTGPTAIIKCNGVLGGTISVGLNGCQKMAVKTFENTSVPDPNLPYITGNEFPLGGSNNVLYTCAPISGATTYTWTLTNDRGTIVSGQGTSAIRINFSVVLPPAVVRPANLKLDVYNTTGGLISSTIYKIFIQSGA